MTADPLPMTVRICRIPTHWLEPVTEARIPKTLAGSQAEVGGMIELVRVTSRLDMYINEEGLLIGLEHNIRASWLAGPGAFIVGPVFVVGHQPGSPGTCDVPKGTADLLNLLLRHLRP